MSCICASLSLPCPVRRPAVALGRLLKLDLVVRCSSTSGAEIEFWHPGTLCWSPVHSTLRRLENLSVFLGFSRLWIRFSSSHCWSLLHWRHLSVVRPASAGDCYLSGLWASDCGGFTHGYGFLPVFLSFGNGGRRCLSTLDALCNDRKFFSGQSWPLLDFPCCGFSAGWCRSCLASPSRCLSEYALSCNRLVSPRCGCV